MLKADFNISLSYFLFVQVLSVVCIIVSAPPTTPHTHTKTTYFALLFPETFNMMAEKLPSLTLLSHSCPITPAEDGGKKNISTGCKNILKAYM